MPGHTKIGGNKDQITAVEEDAEGATENYSGPMKDPNPENTNSGKGGQQFRRQQQ